MKSPVTISAGAVGFGALHSVAVTALRAAFSSMGIITDVGLFEGSGLMTGKRYHFRSVNEIIVLILVFQLPFLWPASSGSP